MEAYRDAWRRYFNFSGRSTRSQFWFYTLTLLVIFVVAVIIDVAILGLDPDDFLLLAAIVNVLHIIPSIMIMVRRLHDIDRSGLWIFIGLVPLVGQIVLLVFACMPSSPNANRFGPPVGEHAEKPAYDRAEGDQTLPASTQLDKLEKLAALRESGAIDDAEFARMKANLLARAQT